MEAPPGLSPPPCAPVQSLAAPNVPDDAGEDEANDSMDDGQQLLEEMPTRFVLNFCVAIVLP